MNLPDYAFLPAPLWLVTTLHVVTLTLHFVAMNFLVGGLIVILHGRFTGGLRSATARRFIKLFPIGTAATVTLGIAPLLFLQLVYPRQMYSAAIVSAWFWLLIIPAVVIGYSLLYSASFRIERDVRPGRWMLLTALVAFVYVSLVYSSVFSMAERPDLVRELYSKWQSGLLWNPNVNDYLFRWLHMILGAVTVGGFFVALLGKDDPEAFETGRRFFLWGMVAASFAGFAYLSTMGSYMAPFMRSPGIWSLTIGIALAMGSLHFFFKRLLLPSGLMVFFSLLCMVVSRHYVRLVKLQGQFDPAMWKVAPQWSPFLLFLVCFVVALVLLGTMIQMFFRGTRDSL